MVVLFYKKSELNKFKWETSSKILIEDLIERVCFVNNLRLKIEKLAGAIEGLAEHGPLKPEALRGLTMPETIEPAIETLPADQKKWAVVTANMTQRENPDPTGYRVGVAPMAEIADKMKEVCKQARDYVSRNKAAENKCLVEQEMLELLSLLKGAVMIAYPAYHGIPPWDHVYLVLEETADLQSVWPEAEWLNAVDSACWFAGRELYRGKTFAEQVTGGSNEKSTFIIKIEKKGAGAPVKESPIDERTHKEMLAYYYKKQEEQKKLETEIEENYSNSTWANPDNLKNQLVTGGKGVNFKFR